MLIDRKVLEGRLDRIVQALQPMEPVKIVLFGSAAIGKADQLSDIDVVVVAEKVATRFLDRIGDAFDLIRHDFALDILIYTPEEYGQMLREGNSLLEVAEEEGRVLYQRPAA